MLDRYISRTIAVLGMTVAAVGSSNAQNAVKVGMVMPMTGTLASAGQQVIAGARLYIKQHGDTVAGKRIELIVRDDASSGETGKRLIQELIVNEKVDVIGGGLTADLAAQRTAPDRSAEAGRDHDFEHDRRSRKIALLCPDQRHAGAIVRHHGGLGDQETVSARR